MPRVLDRIQQALIEQKYMQGEPSGKWDDSTQAALRVSGRSRLAIEDSTGFASAH